MAGFAGLFGTGSLFSFAGAIAGVGGKPEQGIVGAIVSAALALGAWYLQNRRDEQRKREFAAMMEQRNLELQKQADLVNELRAELAWHRQNSGQHKPVETKPA